MTAAQLNIDLLFDRGYEKSSWEPARPPDTLGELLDSRYMLPLIMPSNPKLIGAVPIRRPSLEEGKKRSSLTLTPGLDPKRSPSQASFRSRGTMPWKLNSKKLRDVGVGALKCVDGAKSASRWYRLPLPDNDEEEERPPPPYSSDDPNDTVVGGGSLTHLTPLTRKHSARRGRASFGDDMEPSPTESYAPVSLGSIRSHPEGAHD